MAYYAYGFHVHKRKTTGFAILHYIIITKCGWAGVTQTKIKHLTFLKNNTVFLLYIIKNNYANIFFSLLSFYHICLTENCLTLCATLKKMTLQLTVDSCKA